MIRTFRHKGLERLFRWGEARGLRQDQVTRIDRILTILDGAGIPEDLALPGLRLHPLRGHLVGRWSVTVSGNWRIVFSFDTGDVWDVDLVDYH